MNDFILFAAGVVVGGATVYVLDRNTEIKNKVLNGAAYAMHKSSEVLQQGATKVEALNKQPEEAKA